MARVAVLFCALVAAAVGLAEPKRCTDLLDNVTEFETLCYSMLSTDEDGLQIRLYNVTSHATAVSYTIAIPPAIVYQQAETEGAFFTLGYFVGYVNSKNQSLLNARTVPLMLRPPYNSNPNHDSWISSMVVAPSVFPTPAKLPRPTYNVSLSPVPEGLYLASQRITFQSTPQPADFNNTCAILYRKLAKRGVEVDLASPYTPTHAVYYTRDLVEEQAYTFECWVGIKPRTVVVDG